MRARPPAGPRTTLSHPRFLGAGVILLVFPLFLVLAELSRVGVFVPIGAALAAVFLVRTMAGPRFGLLATAFASLLVPAPLSFHVAGSTVTIGRLVGWAFLVGWVA